MSRKCPALVPKRWWKTRWYSASSHITKQHLIHYLPQFFHIAAQHMAIHIQCCSDVAVPQPCLDVLGIAASLAQSVNGRMSQIC